MNNLNEAQLCDRIRIEIRQIGIPPRPSILVEIEREFQKEETDYLRLADVIGSDVGITAGLIKVANSAGFGMRKKARTVRECLLALGMHQLVQVVAALSLEKAFGHAPQLTRFWDASAKNARVSAWLANRLRSKCGLRPEDAYTFGLFRDCGIPLLLIPFPGYRDVLVQANAESKESFTAVEDRLMGINHAALGAQLAETWQLAEEFIEAIRCYYQLAWSSQPDAPLIPPLSWTLIAVSQLAEHLIQLNTGLAQSHEWEKAGERALQLLDLTPDELEAIEDECGGVVNDRRSPAKS